MPWYPGYSLQASKYVGSRKKYNYDIVVEKLKKYFLRLSDYDGTQRCKLHVVTYCDVVGLEPPRGQYEYEYSAHDLSRVDCTYVYKRSGR